MGEPRLKVDGARTIMHIGIMFRGDSCLVFLSVCLLLYFDSSVNSGRQSKVEASKNRLLKNGIEGETREKSGPRSLHERRINTLMGVSEKSLRPSSPKKNNDKSYSTRRLNSQGVGKERKTGKFKNKTRSHKTNNKNWKNNKNLQMRLSGIRRKMKKDKLRRFDVEPVFGCSSKLGVGPKGCRDSKNREKRDNPFDGWQEIQAWLNATCTTCWNSLPWHILDMPSPVLPSIPLPSIPYPTINLPSLATLWPFDWPASWASFLNLFGT